MDRRDFLLRSSIGLAAASSAGWLPRPLGAAAPAWPARHAAPDDEAYWAGIRAQYAPPADYIDFDQANTGATPLPVFDAYVRRARELSRAPAEKFESMWLEMEEQAKPAVAAFLGAPVKQVGIVGSATVALNTVLHGFPLARGDEVLVTDHEYPDMIETLLQRARLEGIVVRTVRVPGPREDGALLVERVQQAITPRTKLLLISTVSAWSGEVLPVAAVTAAARARGVAVLVDAAQSVGILDTDFTAMGCDFLGASLHKAIGAPIATGVLLMRPEWIGRVAPLHPPSWDSPEFPMDRYEWSGAFQLAAYATAGDAVAYQRAIGLARKRARLRMLGDRWQSAIAGLPRVRLLTPRDPSRSFGTASIAIDGITSRDLYTRLRKEHGIGTQAKNTRHSPFAEAIRISPAAHATPAEVDKLAAAIAAIARA